MKRWWQLFGCIGESLEKRSQRKQIFSALADELVKIAENPELSRFERATLLDIAERRLRRVVIKDYWTITNYSLSYDEPLAARLRGLPIIKKIGAEFCRCLEEDGNFLEAAHCAKLYKL
jgi:hypothetical protein